MNSLLNLNQAPVGLNLTIDQLRVPEDAQDWQPWLEEIGFLPGEQVTVRRRSLLRKGAVVVRVGHSTFALHPEEAACVWVVADAPHTAEAARAPFQNEASV